MANYTHKYGPGEAEKADPVKEIQKGRNILALLQKAGVTEDFLVIVGDLYYNYPKKQDDAIRTKYEEIQAYMQENSESILYLPL